MNLTSGSVPSARINGCLLRSAAPMNAKIPRLSSTGTGATPVWKNFFRRLAAPLAEGGGQCTIIRLHVR